MSVLVKKLKSQTIEAYVKGAPEVMLDICDKSTCKLFSSLAELSVRVLFIPVSSSASRLSRSLGELHTTWLSSDCACSKEYPCSHVDQSTAPHQVHLRSSLLPQYEYLD